MHFAEFGVVMMLFLIGLELRPQFLWQLRKPILGLGSAQVVGTTAVLAGIGIALGVDWRVALAAAHDPGDVLDRHRAADPGREGPA